MNTLICMSVLFSACLAFAMALPVEHLEAATEGESLQVAESRSPRHLVFSSGYGGYGGYGGGYRRYGGYGVYGHGGYGGYGHRRYGGYGHGGYRGYNQHYGHHHGHGHGHYY